MEHEKKWKTTQKRYKYSKLCFYLEPDVISFKKSLIWDQSQHSSSKRLKITEVWSETPIFMSERKSWNTSIGVTLKNDVEPKSLGKKCWNFAWKNRSKYTFRKKKPEFWNMNSFHTIHLLLVTVAFEDRVLP